MLIKMPTQEALVLMVFLAAFCLQGNAAAQTVNVLPTTAKAKVASPTTPVLRTMLQDYRRYTETLWHPASDSGKLAMGYWGSGKGDGGNEGIRALANTALVYAFLYRDGDKEYPIAERVEPALRYAAVIHTSGGDRRGTDNKKWGNTWQSAMWAANLGMAAYLVKDQLTPETRTAVERVVAMESDRIVSLPPPQMTPGDTKAEENAWNLTAPAVAQLLMPNHRNVGAWHNAVLRYGFNTMPVEADKNNRFVADGKPIREWVTTVQLNPDYTLENHGFFHPVYAMVSPVTLAQAAVSYRLGNKPIPEALKFNTLKGWQMLRYVALEDGEWLYPQGLDWDLHDYEHLHYWTMLATLFRDPTASLLEERTVRFARRRQEINGDGSFVGPSGSLGFAREAVQAERVVFALLMHQQFDASPPANPRDWGLMTASLESARAFLPSGFVVHRAERGLLSFSWKHNLMGLVASVTGKADNPYVTTPNPQSLVGGFDIEGQKPSEAGKFLVNRQVIQTNREGFAAVVDVSRNAGRLRQQIAVATVAPGILVYIDRVTAESDVMITQERGLVIGVENDEVSGGQRRIITEKDNTLTVAAGKAGEYALVGNWASIDDRLSLITGHGSHLAYRAMEKFNRAGAREDFLYGQFINEPRPFKTGATIAERVGLLLPGATAKEAAQIAASLRVEQTATGRTVRFSGPDKRTHTLTLHPDGSATWGKQKLAPVPIATPNTEHL